MKYYKLKVLKDNYIWVLVNNNRAIAIDCGCADSLLNFINLHQLSLDYVLITHAHSDHINGLADIQHNTSTKIICGFKTQNLIKEVCNDIIVCEEEFKIDNWLIKPIATPGHTDEHMCYYFPQNKWLFSGDNLFTLGCGRAFFDLKMLYLSLQNLLKICDNNTLVFPGHNYIESNVAFLKNIGFFKFIPKVDSFYNNLTIPTTLSYEQQYNPFLNIHNKFFKQELGKENLNDFEFFSYLRELKDKF